MATNGLCKIVAAIRVLLVMAIVPASVAVTHTVGNANGWESGVDYTAWVTGKTFRVGDVLEFKYGPSHSVNEVNKAGYDSCGGTPIDTHTDGDTKIDLETVGPKYFICPTAGHCVSGMKLAVTVVAAVSSPPTPSSPAPSPPVAPPPTTGEESPPSDGAHVAGSGSTTPPSDGTHVAGSGSTTPPPPHSPPPPSGGASSGVMNYVMVGMSLVLACHVWIMD
ncbi:hypothetical protein CARUB_v10025032mg [Capsella rubella]|uniref:Phytocyanin domain-containing protein n=1 Tax=Capsella rubella TaxID=81985 RepID=R0HTR0_9BRAS|nr:uclacyanin-2 [Capsella rubella]EOA28800.1 hypothetical protein CARUB_v10025032mg [Capsella rubella]